MPPDRLQSLAGPRKALPYSRSPAAPTRSEDDREWTAEELKVQGVAFPADFIARSRFRTAAGKPLTAHAWKVYDLLMRIPAGRVTTYGLLAKALQSSAQAVGGALRENPFAPNVPCHRVIASDLFIGGFQGEWAPPKVKSSTEARPKTLRRSRKLALLESEGVHFSSDGYLNDSEAIIWSPVS